MNSAHDVGGMHGFGPINPEPEAEEPVFHTDWEKRVFGLTLAAGFIGKWNIDMSRYARERQHPVDYLRHTYYENWLAGLEKLLLVPVINRNKTNSARCSMLSIINHHPQCVSGFLCRHFGFCQQPYPDGIRLGLCNRCVLV